MNHVSHSDRSLRGRYSPYSNQSFWSARTILKTCEQQDAYVISAWWQNIFVIPKWMIWVPGCWGPRQWSLNGKIKWFYLTLRFFTLSSNLLRWFTWLVILFTFQYSLHIFITSIIRYELSPFYLVCYTKTHCNP